MIWLENFPSPVANISGKMFLGAFSLSKSAFEAGAPPLPPPNLLMLPAPLHAVSDKDVYE
jgi:hypothetical protein